MDSHLKDIFTEYKALVQDLITYLVPEQSRSSISKPIKSKEKHGIDFLNRSAGNSQKGVKNTNSSKIQPEVPSKIKNEKNHPKTHVSTANPESFFQAPFLDFFRKTFPNKTVFMPTHPIIIAYPRESKEIFFIEKIASTLSAFFLPTSYYSYDTIPLLRFSPTLKLLIAPSEFFKNNFPVQVEDKIHQISKHNSIYLFALADFKCYVNNVELKRSLWNNLKKLPKLLSNFPSESF